MIHRLSSQTWALLKVRLPYNDYAYAITESGVAIIRLVPSLLAFSSKVAFIGIAIAILISVFFSAELFIEGLVILLLVAAAVVSFVSIQLNWRKILRLHGQHLSLPLETTIPWEAVRSGELRGTTISLVADRRKVRGTIDEAMIGWVEDLLKENAADRIKIERQ